MYHPQKSLLAAAIGLALLTETLQADTTSVSDGTETLVITGQTQDVHQASLDTIAGGTNLITPKPDARLTTLRDALDYQPGLVIQEFFGGIDQPRLNIRGSGIQSNPVNRGVLLLEDGLPLNEADGSFVIGTLEPRDSQHILVKRGANAREPGATTLGGSLNFIPRYGSQQRQKAANQIRIEGGSFGRLGGQASLNTVWDKGDFHLSASADSYDGYRNHSAGERQALRANTGVRINDQVFSHFYLNHTQLDFDIPFVVPKSRIDSNPEGVMGDGSTPQDNLLNTYKRDPHRTTDQTRLANRTVIKNNNDSRHILGIYLQQTDDSFVDPLSHADTDSKTLGLQWQYEVLLNRSELELAASWDQSDMQREYFANNPNDGSKMQQFADLDMTAQNTNLSATINHPLTDRMNLDGQLRWNRACRDASNQLNTDKEDHCWNETNARLGINYRTSPQQRWYANISRSSEAPTFWEISEVTVAPNNPSGAALNLTELDTQTAVTLELGGQGEWADQHFWSLSLYRSQVSDELISSADMVGGRGLTTNYSDDTRHQGIELGLHGGNKLHYRLAWNYSDFTFDGGQYDGNTLGGIPEHIISGELGYRFGQLDLSTNLRWLPEDTWVDHENTQQQDSYRIWGMKASYQPEAASWHAFIQVDNLADEKYASAFVIRNRSAASQPTFLPGNGRSVNAGVAFKF